MQKILLLSALLVIGSLAISYAGGLPIFGAELGKLDNPIPFADPIRLPYQDMVSYYGYIKQGSTPDAVVDGKKMYYVYVWIPVAAPELGLRMVSPVPNSMAPSSNDFVSSLWNEGKSDATNYFDTWIDLERAVEVINPADIAVKGKSSLWIKYDNNDDSSELPAQPSGSKYNSVLRVAADHNDPLKTLVRGLYRIGFTTYKTGEVQGSFVAQIGAPIKLPGVAIASSLEGIAKLAK
jgi:hypothetical protein